MNALHCWMPINTEFGHSARFFLSSKTACAEENGPPRLPAPSFVRVELRRTRPSQPCCSGLAETGLGTIYSIPYSS
jgi:hypothetical protein